MTTHTPAVPLAPKTSPVRERLTVEEFTARYAGQPYELVRGQLMEQPASYTNRVHSMAVAAISYLLLAHVLPRKLGKVCSGDAGFVVNRKDATLRGVDVAFISEERLSKNDPESPWITVAPELVVEVISPSNTYEGVMEKVDEYFAFGVEHVWIVEPARQQVQVYSSPTEVSVLRAADGDILRGRGVLADFAVQVKDLFG